LGCEQLEQFEEPTSEEDPTELAKTFAASLERGELCDDLRPKKWTGLSCF
jgi:hypothetical protein